MFTTTKCAEYRNGSNIDLENPLNENVLSSEIIIDNSVIISDINIEIKIECEDTMLCGFEFNKMSLFFQEEDVSKDAVSIDLVASFLEGGETFTNTTFDNEADNEFDFDSKPYIGNFKPIGNLSESYGKNAKGTWALSFTEPNFSGTSFNTVLNSWTLEICNG